MTDRYFKSVGFDPNWTEAEAWRSGLEQEGNQYGKWRAWHRLNTQTKERYERGDAVALMSALYTCARMDLPLPDWVAKHLRGGLDDWLLGCKELEDAFNLSVEKPKGKVRKRNISKKIYTFVNEYCKQSGQSVPGGEEGERFWKSIAKEHGFESASTAERHCIYYSLWLKRQDIEPEVKGLNMSLIDEIYR